MVLAGNIGKFSLLLRQPGEGLSLQTRPMTDDDLDGFGWRGTTKVSSAGPESNLCQNRCAPGKENRGNTGNTKVTIYNGTDCKLRDGVCEGELLGR